MNGIGFYITFFFFFFFLFKVKIATLGQLKVNAN